VITKNPQQIWKGDICELVGDKEGNKE